MITGLTQTSLQDCLESVLPTFVNRYVGLLTTMPTDRTGAGLVEASGGGYDRALIVGWLTTIDGDDVYRENNAAITFPALTSELLAVVGWGIWDANPGGTLLAFGRLVDSGNEPISKDFMIGDEPQFALQELRVGFGEINF